MNKSVRFYPTKNLFIDTLTRDINIRDCILDLVDNSVDSYILHNIRDKRQVRIEYDKSSFKISDNCGGISQDYLTEEVFRIGPDVSSRNKPTIGFYGIGLKRSIFKLGRNIIFETDDGQNYSKLIINVEDWLEQEDSWDIPLDQSSGKSRLKSNGNGKTVIEISGLTPETVETFTTKFENDLRKTIQTYYSLYAGTKINFIVNGVAALPSEIKIELPLGSKPAISLDSYDSIRIKIICWLQHKPEEKRGRRGGPRGWTVFMNDRLVLPDDTSKETGWTGEKSRLPRYHQIYNEFKGLVFLNTNIPTKLPINTRKTGFDTESKAYEYILERMIQTAKPVVSFLTNKYASERDYIASETETQPREKRFKSISLEQLGRHQEFSEPTKYRRAKIHGPDETVMVKFKAPRKLFELAMKHTKAINPEQLGLKLLEYYLDQESLL